jgi:uncharacterized protein (DUF58 family)
MSFWTKFQSRLNRLVSARRPFKLTKGGWVFILYTIGVGAGAINTGNNLLYLIFGVFLGLILASGVLSDTDLWHVEIDWHFPSAGEAGQPCGIELELINNKRWLPSLSVTVMVEGKLRGKSVQLLVFVPYVPAGGRVHREISYTPPERGRFELERVRLYTQFPFGLLRKRWTIFERETEPAQGFFVYPAIQDISHAEFVSMLAGHDQAVSSERRGDGSLISGLREFTPTDSAKHIHWKASAKRGSHATLDVPSWFVRETDLDQKPDVRLIWPVWTALREFSSVEFERFVVFTASLYWSALENGHAARFYVEGPALVEAPLDYLSVVEAFSPPAAGPIEHSFGVVRDVDVLDAYRRWNA